MGNAPIPETSLIRDVMAEVRSILPRDWSAQWEPSHRPDHGLDFLLQLRSPDGQNLRFAVELKTSTQGPAMHTAQQVKTAANSIGAHPLLATDYANPALRQACETLEVSYVDTTGWVAIDAAGPPGLLIRSQGASRSPITRPSSINRLDGPGATRVIRTLWTLNTGQPIGVRELAEQAGVSPGTVSKVLPALESFGAIVRDGSGRVLSRDRRLILQRWTQDYNFRTSNRTVGYYLAPRGLITVEQTVRSALPPGLRISSTGPSAVRNELAHSRVPMAVSVLPQTTAVFYTDDPQHLAGLFGVVRAPQQTAANVILVEPRDLTDSALLPTYKGSPAAVPQAPRSQVLADLMTMGGRYPELAEQLLDLYEPLDREQS